MYHEFKSSKRVDHDPNQSEMFYTPPRVDSDLELSESEHHGLRTQLDHVREFMSDGKWHSVEEISRALDIGFASADKQPRNLRMTRFGGHEVQMRRKPIKAYRLVLKGGE